MSAENQQGNLLTHPLSPELIDRAHLIVHLRTHPEHAWRYPAGHGFAGVLTADIRAAHRRHHEASPS